ncbi:MAG: PRC-barrel domain-containing protein [Aureliella sp.]
MRKLICPAVLMIVMSQGASARTQEDVATRADQPQVGETITLASQLIKSTSRQDVEVRDLVVDLETAHVALLVVSWKHAEKTYQAVLPWSDVLPNHALDSTFWKTLSRVPPKMFNRALANAVYSTAKRDIYWSDSIKFKGENTEFDQSKYELSPFSALVGRSVVDKIGEPIGEIVDLGVNDQSGSIAYCILKTNGSDMRAIPLGAFTISSESTAWKIDLNKSQIFAFETCDLGDPPQAIARGWQEYVAVKYGREGVQEAAVKNK